MIGSSKTELKESTNDRGRARHGFRDVFYETYL